MSTEIRLNAASQLLREALEKRLDASTDAKPEEVFWIKEMRTRLESAGPVVVAPALSTLQAREKIAALCYRHPPESEGRKTRSPLAVRNSERRF